MNRSIKITWNFWEISMILKILLSTILIIIIVKTSSDITWCIFWSIVVKTRSRSLTSLLVHCWTISFDPWVLIVVSLIFAGRWESRFGSCSFFKLHIQSCCWVNWLYQIILCDSCCGWLNRVVCSWILASVSPSFRESIFSSPTAFTTCWLCASITRDESPIPESFQLSSDFTRLRVNCADSFSCDGY